jgi:hypothetical protein
MGEEIALPEVALGYQVDHFLNDCDDSCLAMELVRKELPARLPRCTAVAAPILEDVPKPAWQPVGSGLR